MPARRLSIYLTPVLLALAACREGKVTSYTIPKEPDPQLPAPAAAPGDAQPMTGNVPTEQGPGLTWKAPADWKPGQTSAMRKGSYTLAGPEGTADLSITAFPGDVGGELANVNRWRGQAGLGPLSEANLDQNVDRVEISGLHFLIVDLWDGKGPTRILGALVPYDNGVWFFKLTGPQALVARAKPQFLAFLQTVRPPAS